jgi:hypothetical protein
MKTDATTGKVTNPGTGSPNLLLYTGNIGGGGANIPPTAAFVKVGCTATEIPSRFRCTVNGSSSSDPDGTIVSYAWSTPGRPNRSGVQATWVFGVGSPVITLVVTDNGGATGTVSAAITVP